MNKSKDYSLLRQKIRQDPARAKRLDAGYKEIVGEYRRHALCDLRKSLELTQSELADKISVTQSTISQLENGVIEMSLSMLRSLIKNMGGELQLIGVFEDRTVVLEI